MIQPKSFLRKSNKIALGGWEMDSLIL